MKRFLSFLCFGIILCMLAFAGCSDNDWTEVQSITYSVNGKTVTYTSKITFTINRTETDENSYNNAENKESALGIYDGTTVYNESESFTINRAKDLSDAKALIGNESYICFLSYDYINQSETYSYVKDTISSYTERYVKIRFVDSKSIEINFYENEGYETIRVLPSTYEITYFSD